MHNYADLGRRFVAMFVDNFLVNIITVYLWYMGFWYVGTLVWLLYFMLFEGSPLQATPGKKLMGIVVVDQNGGPVGYGLSFLRTLCKIVSITTLGIGFLVAAFSDRKQALHDMMVSTYVVEARSSGANQRPVSGSLTGQPHIVGITGEFAGKSFGIGTNGVMMGRDRVACQIVFQPDSQGVSRHHCVINYAAQTRMLVLNDVGSSNGTFTGTGVRVDPGRPVALSAGERFYLGDQNCLFEFRL